MSQSGVEISDAGSNTEPRSETTVDIGSGEPVAAWWLKSHAKEEKYAIYKAANKGDWETAERIYETNKLPFHAPITSRGETALHIAALAGQTQFVRELIDKMSHHEHWYICKAIDFAVVTGDVALVEAMLEKCSLFSMTAFKQLWEAILRLILLGRKDVVTYLYEFCEDRVEDVDRANLLVALIDADMYDMAWDLATREWFAASRVYEYKVDALIALARKPRLANTFPQAPSSIINQCWNLVTSCKAQKNSLYRSAYELAKYISYQVCPENEINIGHWVAWKPIAVAARQGNVEFLQIIIERFPDALIQRYDGQTIFHIAVLFRHAEVFDLLSELGSFSILYEKYRMARERDENGNTLLHAAGEVPHSEYLDAVPGEALKLQRELLWFERVKKFVGPVVAEWKNAKGDSPDDVFKKTHKDLIKKGEEWMKKTADSCTIVAALVATVVFAAAFTAPGGNNQNTGFPMFLNEASFKTFIVSDAISLIFALSSLLTFMSIQTSTYSLKDFVWSLPTKLLIGYSTLFVSIASMMVAFVTVLFVYFWQHQLLSFALPLALVAVFPIALFARLHYRLLAGMIMFWQALKNIHD